MSSAREPQLPLDTPDPLTCWPTAMTRAIAPLGGEAYLDEIMDRLLPMVLSKISSTSKVLMLLG